jgi:hypothetical protein
MGALNGVWWSKDITKNRKKMIYNSMVKSILQTKSILDKIDEYRWHWLLHCKECHKTESL